MLRPVTRDDAAAICAIYNYYVKNTAVSFEERPVSIQEMEKRIRDVTAEYPWLVCEEESEIPGYAYVNKYKDRIAYRYTAELSIYLKNGREGKGLGTRLLAGLLEEVKKTGLHALVAGITLPNERSVAIHEKFGFTKAAHFKEAGFKMGRWQDVGYWELILEK
ncbi:MAG: GNAT family N-acetyltransferase [Treponema sp.]|jgi:phosphinothricin acetyltransferase|nr:GNAT family N-acetyltransferase [Treponema sp.]